MKQTVRLMLNTGLWAVMLALAMLCPDRPATAGEPLPIKIRRITDNSALIEYRGSTGIFSPGDERLGIFRIIDVSADRVTILSLQDKSEQTFTLGGSAPQPDSPANSGNSGSSNAVITAPGGKGGFKIIGIIGNKGAYSVIMEKGGVQLTLTKDQTVEGHFTVKDVQAASVILHIIPENLTGTFAPGNEILSGKDVK